MFFLSPFVVGEGEVRTLKLKLDRTTGTVTVFSDTETSPHVTATVVPVDPEPAPVHDLAAVRARCTQRVERFDGYSQQPFMEFGPRWGSLRSIEYGDGEALVTTEMPPEFASELDDLWLHPALMDVATGSAQALIPGFAPEDMFYVPFSYARVLSRGPLPATAVSHVRLRSAYGQRPRCVRHHDQRRARQRGGRDRVVHDASHQRVDLADLAAAHRARRSPSRLGSSRRSAPRCARASCRPRASTPSTASSPPGSQCRSSRPRSTSSPGWRRSTPRPRRPMTKRTTPVRSTSDRTSAPTSSLRPRRSNASWPRCGAGCSVSSGSVATTTSSSSADSR